MKGKYNTIYVLWSGGLDSTYLIQHVLKNPKNKVIAGYVEIINNKYKTKSEKDAIQKMIPFFKEIYKDRFQFLDTVLRTEVIFNSNWIGLVQMPIWMSTIMSTTPSDVDQIAIGYVMNDCAISYLNDFSSLIKKYGKLSSYGQKQFPKVIFPLSKFDKDMISNDIVAELSQHVVWCENPHFETFKPCGRCIPCKRSPLYREEKQEILLDNKTMLSDICHSKEIAINLT